MYPDRTSWNSEQVAKRLNVKLWRVHELVRQDILPHYRLGRQVRFDPESIEEFIRAGGKALPGGWRRKANTGAA